MRLPAISCALLCLACSSIGRRPSTPDSLSSDILPLAQRALIRDDWLEARLDRLVPELMRRAGIDLWLVIGREYNEDPVLETMLPATWLRARRRTVLVFHDPGLGGDEPRRFAVSRYDVGRFFEGIWDPEEEPDQWRRLGTLLRECAPGRIAINVSRDFALADGLSSSEHQALLEVIPDEAELVATPALAVGWLETRLEEELEAYPGIVRIAHGILAEGLSKRAITPGETTTEELAWWFRERAAELRLSTWFQPSVSVQRPGDGAEGSFASRPDERVIERGDLVHVDFGITYLGLNTDTQQHAYVLREGEDDAPQALKDAFVVGNRLQDILTSSFVAGRSGNEILRAALAQAREEGIEATIYTHPIGLHGHGAGPTIGLWDRQGGVPGRGDYPLHADTAYAIELNAALTLPGWGEKVRIMLEEDAWFDGREVRYLDGRQTALFLVR